MKRKNKKRIDPRYFLEETTNRDQFVEQKAKPETGPVPKHLKDKPIGYEEKVGSKSVEYDDEGNVIKCKATGQMKCPQKENKAPIKEEYSGQINEDPRQYRLAQQMAHPSYEGRYPVKVPPYQPPALQPQVVLEKPPLAGGFTDPLEYDPLTDPHNVDYDIERSMFPMDPGVYPTGGSFEPTINPGGEYDIPETHIVGKRDESTAAESALFAAEDDAADEDEAYLVQDAVAATLPGEVLQEQVGFEVGGVDDAEMAAALMRGVSSGNQMAARAAYDILTQFAIYSSGFNHSLLASKIGRILKAYYLREKYGVEGAFLRDWVTGDKPLSAGMSVRVSPWEETKISASEMQTILAQAIRMAGDRKEHPEVLSRLAAIEDQGTRSEPRLSEAKLNQAIQEELQKLLQEFGGPAGSVPFKALEPLPADEMDELMGIVHGDPHSGTIYDTERLVGTLDKKLGSGEIDQEDYDHMRTAALMGDIWRDFDPRDS